MKTAGYARLLGGALCLYGCAVFAAESAAYRGLKVPTDGFENDVSFYGLAVSATGLKRTPDVALPDFGPIRFSTAGPGSTRRYSAGARDFTIGLYRPIGNTVAALAQPNIHSLHGAVPRYTLSSQMMQALPGGWGIGLGVRQTAYGFSTTNLLSISAERQLGSFRGGYTMYSKAGDGLSLGSAHRFEVSYLYGERNSVGLAYTTGRDIDPTAHQSALASAEVRDWTLSGRHWLSPNWALTYDLLNQEQGTLFRRQGLRLGVSRSF